MKFKLLVLIFFSCLCMKVYADDNGFRITPSVSVLAGFVDGKNINKGAANVDLTYLVANRFEMGVGAGYHDIRLNSNVIENFTLQNGTVVVANFVTQNAHSFPYYLVARYGFDLNEDSYIVFSALYGRYYINHSARKNTNTQLAYTTNNDFSNMSFFATAIGYEISGAILSVEYRIAMYDQVLSYSDNNSAYKTDKVHSKNSHYIGVNLAYRFDLF